MEIDFSTLSDLDITESRPLKNAAQEYANELEKTQGACVTLGRAVNLTVNHVLPCVGHYHVLLFLLRLLKCCAIHRRRIDVFSRFCSLHAS